MSSKTDLEVPMGHKRGPRHRQTTSTKKLWLWHSKALEEKKHRASQMLKMAEFHRKMEDLHTREDTIFFKKGELKEDSNKDWKGLRQNCTPPNRKTSEWLEGQIEWQKKSVTGGEKARILRDTRPRMLSRDSNYKLGEKAWKGKGRKIKIGQRLPSLST